MLVCLSVGCINVCLSVWGCVVWLFVLCFVSVLGVCMFVYFCVSSFTCFCEGWCVVCVFVCEPMPVALSLCLWLSVSPSVEILRSVDMNPKSRTMDK